jgi:alanine racemase
LIPHPNRITIDLSALEHNLNQVKRLIDPGTRIMGIVKSDGYGHGLLRVSQLLEKKNIYALGVAHLHEALQLRLKGIKVPIVVLCGIRSREDSEEVVEKALRPVVYDLSSAEILSQVAVRKGKKVNIHLKIDTGMGRLGIPYKEAGPFMEKVLALPGLNIEALMSHLSSADEENGDFTDTQIRNFKHAVDIGRSMGIDPALNNLANSAGIMAHKESHFKMVRPGIMLYGGLPSPGFKAPLSLRPVMGLKGRILQIRDLPDSTPVSYGRRYVTEGPMKIAVVSAGYGDGLPRNLSNRGTALIRGKKTAMVGAICMNMVICDVTRMEDVMPGDEAILLGIQGDQVITADDIAGLCDTISYEILLSIGTKGYREYI